jgi:eukaryotic translation initiation factor 2C
MKPMDKELTVKRLERLQQSKSGALDFPPRANFSESDSQVITNHFEMHLTESTTLYEYKVISTVPTKIKRKLRALMERVIENTDALRLNREHFATDLYDTIVAWEPLDALLGQPTTGIGDVGSEWHLTDLVDRGDTFKFRLKFERKVDVYGLKRYTQTDPDAHNLDKAVVVNALNVIVFDNFERSDDPTVQIGANKFYLRGAYEDLCYPDPSDPKKYLTSKSLCTIRGYSYTVKPGIDKVLLNVNTATSAFYKPQRVSELMKDNETWGGTDLEDVLRGLRVRIDYERGDKKNEEAFTRLNSEEGRVKVIDGLGKATKVETFRPKDPTGQILPPRTIENHLQIGKCSECGYRQKANT